MISDSHVMSKSGKVWTVDDLAGHYGFVDIDGKKQPLLHKCVKILSVLFYKYLKRKKFS